MNTAAVLIQTIKLLHDVQLFEISHDSIFLSGQTINHEKSGGQFFFVISLVSVLLFVEYH